MFWKKHGRGSPTAAEATHASSHENTDSWDTWGANPSSGSTHQHPAADALSNDAFSTPQPAEQIDVLDHAETQPDDDTSVGTQTAYPQGTTSRTANTSSPARAKQIDSHSPAAAVNTNAPAEVYINETDYNDSIHTTALDTGEVQGTPDLTSDIGIETEMDVAGCVTTTTPIVDDMTEVDGGDSTDIHAVNTVDRNDEGVERTSVVSSPHPGDVVDGRRAAPEGNKDLRQELEDALVRIETKVMAEKAARIVAEEALQRTLSQPHFPPPSTTIIPSPTNNSTTTAPTTNNTDALWRAELTAVKGELHAALSELQRAQQALHRANALADRLVMWQCMVPPFNSATEPGLQTQNSATPEAFVTSPSEQQNQTDATTTVNAPPPPSIDQQQMQYGQPIPPQFAVLPPGAVPPMMQPGGMYPHPMGGYAMAPMPPHPGAMMGVPPEMMYGPMPPPPPGSQVGPPPPGHMGGNYPPPSRQERRSAGGGSDTRGRGPNIQRGNSGGVSRGGHAGGSGGGRKDVNAAGGEDRFGTSRVQNHMISYSSRWNRDR